MDPETNPQNKALRRGAWALWIGVVLMFLLIITAWVTLIKIARENPVEQIELDEHRTSNAQH